MHPTDSNTTRVKLFKNDQLERMTLISPGIFAAFWAIALPLIAWAGWGVVDPWMGLALVLAGIVVWTVFEYAMHRYLFHLETEVSVVKWFVYLIHGNHHEDPNDALRGLMPLPASLPIAGTVWLVLSLLFGAQGTWLFLGFMIGYVIYDVIHFACHQWAMDGKLTASIKRHHMRHHYVNDNANFAISAIFWDQVFGSKIKRIRQEQGN